tara:strand:+ start:4304 stop:4540 length:237 start_codon:yes stop_codon:yes gene_type:complete
MIIDVKIDLTEGAFYPRPAESLRHIFEQVTESAVWNMEDDAPSDVSIKNKLVDVQGNKVGFAVFTLGAGANIPSQEKN